MALMPESLKPRGRPRAGSPRRDVWLAVSLKLAMLMGLYLLFFTPPHRPAADASATARAIVGSSVAGAR